MWHGTFHWILDAIFGEPYRDPLDRLPWGVQVVKRAARRGGYGGATLGAIAGFVVFKLLPADKLPPGKPVGMLPDVLGEFIKALLCVAVGALLMAAIGYAIGEAVGARRRRRIEEMDER